MDHPDDALDRRFMSEALGLAARIPRRPWPNPPVGAVVVRDGRIVGRGAHHGAGTDHAEVAALREAGDAARGATLYCTLEPCNHHGRTPPCAPVVGAAGIARAVIALADPNPRVAGGGLDRLRRDGIDTVVGVLGEEALELIWPFVASRAFERPFVVLKTATSVDGCFAPAAASPAGEPFYLTGADARRDVHRLRRWCDVVLVGERTMVSDAPKLDGRLCLPDEACPAADPVPAYVDTDLSLSAAWSRRHLVFAGRPAASGAGAGVVQQEHREIVVCDEQDGRVDPNSLVAQFQQWGGHVMLVEGGPSVAAAFLRAGLVDRWISYVAPVVLGRGIRWPDGAGRSGFHLTRTERVGVDVKMVFDRTAFAESLAVLTAWQG